MPRLSRNLPLLMLLASPALAVPPPGHPSVDTANRALGIEASPDALPLRGLVIEAEESNSYTYLLIEQDGHRKWLAAPRLEVAPGTTVRFAPGRTLTNFHSKKLRRTFPAVTFVPRAEALR